jgi:acetylornithine deacetylase/succinyl-diaminopimelate desuccinylase-like protein
MNKQQILQDLETFIAIQSVSPDSSRFDEMLKAVYFLKKHLEDLDFDIETIQEGNAPPLVVASRIISSTAKTIGIYGHYDVQPEDPINEWKSTPFQLTQKKGKLYGRGVADNKGHIVQNLYALKELVLSQSLKNNIVLIFEGEEESGSAHLEPYLEKIRDTLSNVDVFFVTDVGMHSKHVPQIFYGLRGLVYFELTVHIGERDLHSGIYGNCVYNPVQVITDLFSKIKDITTGEILIPGFYDDIRAIDKDELDLLIKVTVTDEQLKKEANVHHVTSFRGQPAYLVSKIYPSCDINGIVSGYTGEGAKTIIPKSATVKFSFRLVEHQDPKKVQDLVIKFIEKNLPNGLQYKLNMLSSDGPFYTSLDNEYVKKTASILKGHFNHEVLFNRSGGSIPVAEMLQRLFHKPIILTGFTLPDDNIHSPNENFDEEMFWSGIEALKKIYGSLFSE